MDTSAHRSLIICSVWTEDGTEKLDQIKQGSGLKIAQSKLSNLFHRDTTDHLATESSCEILLKEEDAKLLVLATDSVALLDPQALNVDKESVEAGEVDTLMYSLPFSKIKEIQSDGRKLVIHYFISILQGEESKVEAGNKTVFGFLSPQKLLPERLSMRDKSGSLSNVFDESFDVRSVSASFIMRSEREAIELMRKMEFHRSRLQSAISWLNDGLPFVKEPTLLTVVKLDTAAQGTSRHVLLSEFPQIGQKILVSVSERTIETTLVVFTLSSPFGPCRASVRVADVGRNEDYQKDRVKAQPILETERFLPDYSISIEYSMAMERGPDESKSQSRLIVPRRLVFSSLAILLGVSIQNQFRIQGPAVFAAVVVIVSILLRLLFSSRNQRDSEVIFSLVYYGSAIVEEARVTSGNGRSQQDEVSEQRDTARTFKNMSLQSTGLYNLADTSVRRSVRIARLGMQQYEMLAHEPIAMATISVTEEEASQLKRLNQISKSVDVDLFRRYIAACKGDRQFAMQRLRTTAEWRAEHNVDSILQAPIPYFNVLKQNYVHAVIGRSKDGMPVVVEGMGKFRETMVALRRKGIVPGKSEEIIHQFVFVLEWITKVLDPTEFPKGQFIRIYDMKGIRFSDVADSEAVHLGKQMMDVLENHYPERMAKAFIINVPGFFSALWSMAKPLLDPHTAKKIKVISKKGKILPALREVMDESVIPKAYGGQGSEDFYDSVEESLIRSLACENNMTYS
eukprot:CAMPEP_0118799432 /NCGR_PEP_ID=MMETSP1161-20130426/1648_1 /TAXON_ID=249345 /ORGANISM="Picochlorum oklahomensis, Strain CCMP2329" /LENGTH=738 /DNA_ID=CAMNT_0006727131 /DNA_START=121 /DNA_END=2337 /DNA_ORIENTATION=-